MVVPCKTLVNRPLKSPILVMGTSSLEKRLFPQVLGHVWKFLWHMNMILFDKGIDRIYQLLEKKFSW